MQTPRPSSRQSGLALVVVLFAVALVSIVVLAYFNLALLNRNTSFSNAGEARANILALSALNFIKGDFVSEIQAGSTIEVDPNGSGVPIYLPSTNATMLPFRMTTNIAYNASIPANLIKWSSGSVAFWTNTASYGNNAGPKRGSSGISTATGSVNGHYVGNSRWTKPDFSTSSSFPSSVVPEWVFMTRQGPLTSSTTAIATLPNPAANNSSYVIGRYAYTVYDEGGLIDITAAGYSPSGFASDATDVGRKGSQAMADLTQIGLTTAQIETLGGWRNVSSWSSASAYTNYLQTNAATSGFLQPAAGDQAFLSRQDLISYWTTQLGANANILPYITTFSREKNAPSWGPEHNANDPNNLTYWNGTNVTIDPVNNPVPTPQNYISYAYRDNQDKASVLPSGSSLTQTIKNRFFPNVRVLASAPFVRLSGQAAITGEPLVKNRFDLNKLSWITYQGIAPGVSPADVYHYFGLTLNPDGSGSWIYNHNSVAVPTSITQGSQIMTLDQIAAAGREPDFFELLQAAILQGTLGLISGDPTHANDNATGGGGGGEYYRAWEALSGVALGTIFPYEAPFVRADTDSTPSHLSLFYAMEKYHIIQIGANMIDQADTDNIPTDIMLNNEHIYGVENLPYISAIGSTVLRPRPGTISPAPDSTFNDSAQQYVHQWATFSLWNPHQNAAYAPVSGTAAPAKIRIAITSGEEYPRIQNLQGYSTPNTYSGRIFLPQMTAGTVTPITSATGVKQGPSWIGLNLSDYTGHFSEPTMIDPNHAFTSDTDNPATSNMNDTFGIIKSSLGWQRAGIYMGWTQSPDNPYKVPLCATLPGHPGWLTNHVGTVAILYDAASLAQISPFIIELQYQDPSTPGPSHWHTYQVFRGVVPPGGGAGDSYMEPNDPSWTQWSNVPPNNYNPTNYPNGYANGAVGAPPATNVTGMIGANAGPLTSDQENAVTTQIDPRSGRLNTQVIHAPTSASNRLTNNIGTSTQTLPGSDVGAPPYGHFPKATVSKNSRDNPNTWYNNLSTDPSYYLDRDFNRRVGDGGGWAGSSPFVTGALAQRPIHLVRPFRSVAELGYVFRDDAWKNLNLFSANSGDAGLLDIFYVGSRSSTALNTPPPDIIAGKMNLNSAAQNALNGNATTSLPLQAMLNAGLRDYSLTTPTTINTSIASADAATLATSVMTYVKANGPLINIGDLPAVFPQDTTLSSANPGLKSQREAFVRALADGTGTRTWNLMIDVVAQAGKFNPTATSMNNFTVEGEKHYWLHVAIDRFTGEIVDQQLEPVWE